VLAGYIDKHAVFWSVPDLLISDSLKWNAKATEKSTTAALTIDRRNLTATIMIENFVHPMICQIRQ
jgi:hypothetical protein